jgi:pimeloyl-ACP methyl ester carboxylesterase
MLAARGKESPLPYADRNGLRIYYEVTGSGEPLFLYHGLTGSGQRWRDEGYAADLGQTYRLILMDARGHGRSDKPHDPAAYSRHERAGDVLAVLDDLGLDAAHFWGHSMGGSIALTLARDHPHRVRSLVITGYSPFAAEGEEAAEMAAWAADLQAGMPGFIAGYEQRHGPLPEDARQRWLENDGAALAACVATMIAEADGRHLPELAQIETPVLFLVGTEEPFADRARRAAALLPRGEFVALAGLDHLETFSRNDLVSPLVQAFLERTTA